MWGMLMSRSLAAVGKFRALYMARRALGAAAAPDQVTVNFAEIVLPVRAPSFGVASSS
jgi:hypothetical protein